MAQRSDTPSANLSAIDLNLFLVLHTVLEEGSATRAASRLHVTQSAVSNALARLRELFQDPLVVRSGRGLVPTPRAQELAPLVAAALEGLQAAVASERFDPAASTRRFALACADNHQFSELPRLLPLFRERLPRASLRMVSVEYLIATDGLATGEVDAVIAPPAAAPPRCKVEPLFEEGGVVVAGKENRSVGARLTREQFEAARFVDVHVAFGRAGVGNRLASEAMAAAGVAPEFSLIVPHFTAAALAAAHTDLLAGLPARFARQACGMLPLRVVEVPYRMPAFELGLVWHPRTEEDAGSRFFRRLIVEALREKPGRRGRG